MEPDSSNYEIWITDWLAGNLSQRQVEQLMEFLEKNPDLKEEADALSLTYLSPRQNKMPGKETLMKSADDLPPSQIEYLSVAYLENDLTEKQLADLRDNIRLRPENKIIFETVQKIKLSAPENKYKYKSSLKKHTPVQRIVRLSATLLSAAVITGLLVLSIVLIPRHLNDRTEKISRDIITDTTAVEPFVVMAEILHGPAEEAAVIKEESMPGEISEKFPAPDETGQIALFQAETDTSHRIFRSPPPAILKIPLDIEVSFNKPIHDYTLIASNNNFVMPEYQDDDRSKLNKFITRTFREKILREDAVSEEPLKSYEIAGAGIEGLNKLLGWEMALVKTHDENGELRSLYFSSGILKFNAPFKQTKE
ncbi:MAG: hypothetical protein JXN62_09625 [Bacteroidales bacterium]|nr:hypothetical protein [Bacteroidales bacterium]